jgi:hypothetical protein
MSGTEEMRVGRFDKLALVMAIFATAVAATSGSRHAHAYYMSQIEAGGTWIWVAGWITATYGPLAVAIWFLRSARKTAFPWILHLLFLPSVYILFWAGLAAMLSVIEDPDFDATLSAPVMSAIILLFVAVAGYFAAVIARRCSTQQAKAKVR